MSRGLGDVYKRQGSQTDLLGRAPSPHTDAPRTGQSAHGSPRRDPSHGARIIGDRRHRLSWNRSGGIALRYRQRPWRSSPSRGLPGLRPVAPRCCKSDAIGNRTMRRARTSCWASGMTGLTRGPGEACAPETGMPPAVSARRCACRSARDGVNRPVPECSTRAIAAPDRPVIESQAVRLSANSLRPERRSTDGQVILEAISD